MSSTGHNASSAHAVPMWDESDFDDLPAPGELNTPPVRAVPIFEYKKAKIGTLVRHRDFPDHIFPIYAFIWFGPDPAVEVSLPDGNRRWTIYYPDCEVLVQTTPEDASEEEK